MSDINNVVIEGRLTKNAEMKTAGQSCVVHFSIANNKSIKKETGYENKSNFFDCEVWGKYADAMFKHLVKGRMLTVIGELVQDQWKDQNGQTNSRIKIKVSEMSVRFPPKDEKQEPTNANVNVNANQNPLPNQTNFNSEMEGVSF